jgi:hypothetical protein
MIDLLGTVVKPAAVVSNENTGKGNPTQSHPVSLLYK